jgi:hypothetical protein
MVSQVHVQVAVYSSTPLISSGSSPHRSSTYTESKASTPYHSSIAFPQVFAHASDKQKRALWSRLRSAASHAPWDFAGTTLFALGSLLYVISSLMQLSGTYRAYGGRFLDVLAPCTDVLSSIAYYKGWQESFRYYALRVSARRNTQVECSEQI